MSFRLHCLAETEKGAAIATATPATTATDSPEKESGVAKVATVAVAADSVSSVSALSEAVDKATAAREARQAKVEVILRAHPEQRCAFDVVDAPLKAGPGEPVSVVVAVRHGEQILSGELSIPRERWSLPAFIDFIEKLERPQ